jgi:hypothetical protein
MPKEAFPGAAILRPQLGLMNRYVVLFDEQHYRRRFFTMNIYNVVQLAL